MWIPNLTHRTGPRYLAIADALEQDIQDGTLAVGAKLPPQRDLAYQLQVTVGTISRAYAEAERRNLVHAEIGRGTFVRSQEIDKFPPLVGLSTSKPDVLDHSSPNHRSAPQYDLSSVQIPVEYSIPAIQEALKLSAASPENFQPLLQYQPNQGMPRHREILSEWLANLTNIRTNPDNILITNGAHHALSLSLLALMSPKETLLCQELTYPALKVITRHLDFRYEGIADDEHGLDPEQLDRTCRRTKAKYLYILPTCQNPLTTTLSLQRRLEILEVCNRHNVTIIEDDVYGFLIEDAPDCFKVLAPERCIHINSFSKSMVPGMRIGVLNAPTKLIPTLIQCSRSIALMSSPLLVEQVCHIYLSGHSEKIRSQIIQDIQQKQSLVSQYLSAFDVNTDKNSPFFWLKLPEPWRTAEFISAAAKHNIQISPSGHFYARSGQPPAAVRLSLASRNGNHVDDYHSALQTITHILMNGPDICYETI